MLQTCVGVSLALTRVASGTDVGVSYRGGGGRYIVEFVVTSPGTRLAVAVLRTRCPHQTLVAHTPLSWGGGEWVRGRRATSSVNRIATVTLLS
jgi:hypothetical protein